MKTWRVCIFETTCKEYEVRANTAEIAEKLAQCQNVSGEEQPGLEKIEEYIYETRIETHMMP